MIGQTLNFLRSELDTHLRAEFDGGIEDPVADKVVFLESEKVDPLGFKEEAVSQVLINVQEERVLQTADPYRRISEEGRPLRVQPDLRLVLRILFVARFKQYDTAWDHLTKVLEYLQTHRLMDQTSHPNLPGPVGRMTFELMSQDFDDLNNVWNMLRSSYLPSVLYRTGLVVLADTNPVAQNQLTQPVIINTRSES